MTQEEIIRYYNPTPQQKYDAMPDALKAYTTPLNSLSISKEHDWSREDMIMRGLQGDKPENWTNI